MVNEEITMSHYDRPGWEYWYAPGSQYYPSSYDPYVEAPEYDPRCAQGYAEAPEEAYYDLSEELAACEQAMAEYEAYLQALAEYYQAIAEYSGYQTTSEEASEQEEKAEREEREYLESVRDWAKDIVRRTEEAIAALEGSEK
jgi:hypothetical protein